MKEAVKEILELKEDCDYKRISVDEILVLKDYITNLQEENEHIKVNNKETLNSFDETMKDIKENLIARINRQECEIHNLQQRIDKAIEYINTHIVRDAEYENYMQCEREEKEELIDILEGKE